MTRPDGPDLLPLLRKNRDDVLARLTEAARRAGRPDDAVDLVAVTKTVRPEVALALAQLGQVDLGENRVAGLEEKARLFQERGQRVRWHFIGHLQRNKARRVARLAQVIHAVDSAPLLETLARAASEEGLRPGLHLQVKLTDEESKHGLAPEEVPDLIARGRELGAPLLGLMTMAPLVLEGTDDVERRAAALRVFRELAALARTLPGEAFDGGRPRLSMGMSGDLEEAVAAGADVVRIGSAFFSGLEGAAA